MGTESEENVDQAETQRRDQRMRRGRGRAFSGTDDVGEFRQEPFDDEEVEFGPRRRHDGAQQVGE